MKLRIGILVLIAVAAFVTGTAEAKNFAKKNAPLPTAATYNGLAWNAFDQADYKMAILWAEKVIQEQSWVAQAQEQQALKAKEVGGLVAYPWGETVADNKDARHEQIWKYSLLNEVSTSLWILAAANFELGNVDESKKWMTRIIEEFPFHQIANVVENPHTGKKDLVNGYWNALVSWLYNPGGFTRDAEMGKFIKEFEIHVNPQSWAANKSS